VRFCAGAAASGSAGPAERQVLVSARPATHAAPSEIFSENQRMTVGPAWLIRWPGLAWRACGAKALHRQKPDSPLQNGWTTPCRAIRSIRNLRRSLALQNLNSTNAELNTTQTRINTGKRISNAKDNGAIWAIAQNQRATSRALDAVRESSAAWSVHGRRGHFGR
jgi:hypothetical protein